VVCPGADLPGADGFAVLSAIMSIESLLSAYDGGNTCAELCPLSPDCSDATIYASFYYTVDEAADCACFSYEEYVPQNSTCKGRRQGWFSECVEAIYCSGPFPRELHCASSWYIEEDCCCCGYSPGCECESVDECDICDPVVFWWGPCMPCLHN
jgi:hypothetical protein